MCIQGKAYKGDEEMQQSTKKIVNVDESVATSQHLEF